MTLIIKYCLILNTITLSKSSRCHKKRLLHPLELRLEASNLTKISHFLTTKSKQTLEVLSQNNILKITKDFAAKK